MSPQPNHSPARLLAPIALVLAVLAIVIVAGSSLGGGDGDGTPTRTAAPATRKSPKAERTETKARSESRSATYTVKAGDTPGSIADDVGITLDRLLELNPELDPNALVAGQKIKLRE